MKKFVIMLLCVGAIHFLVAQDKFAQGRPKGKGLVWNDKGVDSFNDFPEISEGSKGAKAGSITVEKTLDKYVGQVQDQRDTYSCLPFSIAQCLRMSIAINNKWTSPAQINAFCFSPFSLYNYLNNGSCHTGTTFDDALATVKERGICLEKDFPSTACDEQPNATAQKAAKNFKIKDVQSLFKTNMKEDKYKIERIQQAINMDMPVIIGVEVDSAFDAVTASNKYWRPGKHTKKANHAILLIGYDTRRENVGAFQLLNSWGEGWGDKGKCWVRYDDFMKYCRYAVVIVPDVNTNPEPIVITNDPIPSPKPPKNEPKELMGEATFLSYLKWDTDNDKPLFAETPVTYQKAGYFETQDSYKKGQQFQISTLNISKNTFVYVFSFDANAKMERHYPAPSPKEVEESEKYGATTTDLRIQSPLMPTDSVRLLLPSKSQALELDRVGQDNICVLFSSQELTDIENITKKISAASGVMEERLRKVLGERLIPTENIQYKGGNKLAFSAKTDKGYIVPLILKVDVIE